MLRYLQQTTQRDGRTRRIKGQGRNKDTRTDVDAGTCTSVLAACFLSFFLSFVLSSCHFFSCLRFRLQRFPLLLLLLLLLLSPSFLLERCKPLIFGYVFLHFCSLFAFDLIVGSGCPFRHDPLARSLSLSLFLCACSPTLLLPSFLPCLSAMCCLLTFNEMSTKDQALCDFSLALSLSFLHCLPRLVANWALDCLPMSATESQFAWHSPWHSFSIIFRLTKCTQTANTASSVLTCLRPFARLRVVRLVRWQH